VGDLELTWRYPLSEFRYKQARTVCDLTFHCGPLDSLQDYVIRVLIAILPLHYHNLQQDIASQHTHPVKLNSKVNKHQRSNIPGKGLEVPCRMNFTGRPSHVEKLIRTFQKAPQLLLDIVLVPISHHFLCNYRLTLHHVELSARGELGGRFLE